MVPVLVIGDLHIPHRVHDLPPKFKKLLIPSKIQQILCMGNICDKDPETYDYMRTISPDVHAVKGDYDESAFPLSVASMHNLMIGMIHGPQYIPIGDLDSLSSLARQMDSCGTYIHAQNLTTNSSSTPDKRQAHGQELTTGSDLTPSFALMDIQGSVVVTYVYQLIEASRRTVMPQRIPSPTPGSPTMLCPLQTQSPPSMDGLDPVDMDGLHPYGLQRLIICQWVALGLLNS
ncbi:hypothetical protein K443DRAFT_3672 [Laccaria amethystina LaAM-08-1]|uniref:Unplaced genomic scaffold K443scaffold_23, whole genome shotgun sequence n=1 Tax=Laccaria amethystina LaAM-08-1 TaxID=1095629 RepID=A0A0C9Y627_9AGAR|nr:hypothetical protein K443DRAFT_3672 [Laccaria amethystina LaAM-08-1]